MSARLLRGRRGARRAARRRGGSRRGFYAGSTRATRALLGWRMRHRAPVAAGRRRWSSLSSLPLYQLGEAGVHPDRRRRGRVRGQRHRARGHQPRARWTRSMRAVETEICADAAACARVLVHGRRRLPRRRQPAASVYVRIAPHEERAFSLRRALARDAAAGKPLARLPRQLHAARRDAGGARRLAQVHATCASRCATAPSFNIGGGNFDIDFVDPRARPRRRSPRYAERAARRRAGELGGIVDADTTLQARQARAARRRSTASAPPTWASTPRDIAHGAAAHGRRRRRGLALPRRRGQRGLRRRSCGSTEPVPRATPDAIARLYVPSQRAAASCASTTS